jgi:hypothetical protein
MIWIVVYVVAGLVGLIVLMAVIGYALRPDHLAARSAEVPGAPADVYAAIRDVEQHPSWRKDVKRIELLAPVDGKRSFREHGRQGAITFVVDQDQAPEPGRPGRLVTRIADDKLPFGGRWIIEVASTGAGSRVTVTEDGFVKNPVFRFLSRTVFSLTATLEHWLRALGRRQGAEVVPEPAEPVR